jgi:nucleoside-diphosphate-sugar epimerase
MKELIKMFRISQYCYKQSNWYNMLQVTIGDGKNYDDFVYVENVVHGHLCAEKTLSTIEGARTSGGKVYFYY